MPDVNALMQQRVRGAENIYQIETARQAQAKEEAKAQENAAVEALFPAYSYVLETGDLAGGLELAPPQYRDVLIPHMKALEGRSLPEIQAALTGSLVASESGRALLENRSRAATLGVQLQQAETAAAREAREAKEAGQPKPMSEFEKAQSGFREREVLLKEQEAKDKATLPEGMDAKTKAKFDQALPKAKASLRTTFSAYANDIADVQALLADDAGIAAITGAFNANTPDITKDATRAAGLLKKIRAGNMFSALQELRVNSPTGAAVGNVSNEEGRNLRDSVAALDRAQSAEDFKRALSKLAVDLEVARRNVAAAFDDTYGYRNDVTSTDMETEARAIREAAEREIGKTTPLPTQQPSGYRIINQRAQR